MTKMFSEMFVRAETEYRHGRYLAEAAEDRLARCVPGRLSRSAALLHSLRLVRRPAAQPATPCAG